MSSNVVPAIHNGIYLVVAQAANYIIPILLLPHISENLNKTKFGIVVFGISFMQILNICVDFGFSLSGVKINQEKDKNKYYSAVLIIKIAIFLFSAVSLLYYVHASGGVDSFNFSCVMAAAAFFSGITPNWLFSSIEKMKPIMYANIISRVILFGMVFFLVRGDDEYMMVANSFLITNFVVFVASFLYAKKLGYFFCSVSSWLFVKKVFKDGLHFFWARAALSLYTSGSVLFLGLYGGLNEAAKYSIAEQIYKGIQGIFGPFSQAMYPYMIKTKNYKKLYIVILFCFVLSIMAMIIINLVGEKSIIMLYGKNAHDSYDILKIFGYTVIVTSVSVFMGYPLYGALQKTSVANNSVIIGGITQAVLVFLMYRWNLINAITVAYSVLFSEMVVLLVRTMVFVNFKLAEKND